MTPEQLDRIEKLAKEATPGPYSVCEHDGVVCSCGNVWSNPADALVAVAQGIHHAPEEEQEGFSMAQMQANARFLACVDPSTALEMVAEIRILQAARDSALAMAVSYGGIDGAHHKAWVIDQVVRSLAGLEYAAVVAEAKSGDDGLETYDWDEGIAP